MNRLTRAMAFASVLALITGCTTTGGANPEDQANTAKDGETPEATTPGGSPDVQSYGYGKGGTLDSYEVLNNPEEYGSRSGATPAPGTAAGGQPVAGGQAVSSDRIIYFDFDSSDVRPDFRPVLETNARYLMSNPAIITQLEGHTDERGSREYNIALGERRAEAVRRMLAALGVAPQRIRTVSFGEERPASPGQDEASYAQNRRVEIVY